MAIFKIKNSDGSLISIPALKGEKGDTGKAFTYGDFTQDQLNALKPTATDTYSATSSDAMSGKAVASAVKNKADLSGATFTGNITVPKIITSTGLEIY